MVFTERVCAENVASLDPVSISYTADTWSPPEVAYSIDPSALNFEIMKGQAHQASVISTPLDVKHGVVMGSDSLSLWNWEESKQSSTNIRNRELHT